MKPLVLLATPRTGSSPVFEALSLYYTKKYNINNLDEIFNFRTVYAQDTRGRLLLKGWVDEGVIGASSELLEKVAWQRVKMLKKSPKNYFVKVFPHQIPQEAAKEFWKEHQIIALEREDKFEQLLSCLISFGTGYYYSGELTKLGPKSVIGKRLWFDLFERDILYYMFIKTQFTPTMTIVYEDFFKEGRAPNLKPWGIDFKWNPQMLSQPIRRSVPKHEVIANLKEVRSWYKNSFLQSMFPI